MTYLTGPETTIEIPETQRKRLIKLMRPISWANDLHSVIDAKTGALTDRPDAVPLLLRVMKNSLEANWRERTAALIALRYIPIPLEDLQEAASVIGKIMLGNDTNTGQRVILRGLWLVPRWLLCLIPLLIFWLLNSALPYDTPLHYWIDCIGMIYTAVLLLYTLALPIASPGYDMMRTGRVRMEATQTLAVLQLPESVGALARVARSIHLRADIARNALLRLLPTLTEAHYGQIGADATPELCALLSSENIANELKCLTVEALGKMGDGRAVEPVMKLAQLRRDSALRELATNILPILRFRREQENAAAMLLRGSSAPPVEAGELLRAASHSAVTPPEMLLRPAPETPDNPASQGSGSNPI